MSLKMDEGKINDHQQRQCLTFTLYEQGSNAIAILQFKTLPIPGWLNRFMEIPKQFSADFFRVNKIRDQGVGAKCSKLKIT